MLPGDEYLWLADRDDLTDDMKEAMIQAQLAGRELKEHRARMGEWAHDPERFFEIEAEIMSRYPMVFGAQFRREQVQ
jgi:hypothetical protein